jgi:hypothetical protein
MTDTKDARMKRRVMRAQRQRTRIAQDTLLSRINEYAQSHNHYDADTLREWLAEIAMVELDEDNISELAAVLDVAPSFLDAATRLPEVTYDLGSLAFWYIGMPSKLAKTDVYKEYVRLTRAIHRRPMSASQVLQESAHGHPSSGCALM